MSHYFSSILALPPLNLKSHRQHRPNMRLPNPTPSYETSNKLRVKYGRVFVGLAIVIFLLSWRDMISNSFTHLTSRISSIEEEDPILNSTLGFQNIFVLSLPDRVDRREPLIAGANATNMTLTVLDAVRDRQIPESEWPESWATNGWTPKEGELGCLMSHVKTWRKIIDENITSALIMESDADWDMRIKQTMVGIGEGTKAIADWPFDPPSPSTEGISKSEPRPYGDKWDILWIGHCGSSAKGDGRIFAFNDSAAPDEGHVWVVGERPTQEQRPPGTRVVYQLDTSVCTTSYAISNQGARKFEKIFREANAPIDLKMCDICANDHKFACIGVWPQVISMTESKTNMNPTEGGFAFGHDIEEEKIVAANSVQVSARVNAHLGTADKGPDGWIWEWSDEDSSQERGEEDREAAEVDLQSIDSELKDEVQQEEGGPVDG
ncbi:MAG: hypothetical protein Q9217_006467 [Psora testacea]